MDGFFHPVATADEQSLFSSASSGAKKQLQSIESQLTAHSVSSAIVQCFDSDVIDNADWLAQIRIYSSANKLAFSWLPNLRSSALPNRIRRAAEAGFCSIVLHPYLQDIQLSDEALVCDLARHAAEAGMFVILCTAYGSRKIYSHQSLPLAAAVAAEVDCPVVLAHCGGAKIVEAMLLADAYANIFLETSFTLPYWMGSSVETDIAFAIRKLGPERWLFGSDAPFVPMGNALAAHRDFFLKHDFSEYQIEQIMGGTALRLLGWQS